MSLHVARVTNADEAPSRWLAVVHGILGCGGNWRTFARTLVQRDPGLGVLLLDLRHHGRSGALDGACTMAACALDLEDTFTAQGVWPGAIAGHSFGGKVVLDWAHRSERPPQEVWVLDSPPGLRNHGSDPGELLIGGVLRAMERVPTPAAERSEVIDSLIHGGVPRGVAAWLSTNLRLEPGKGYGWRLDLEAIRALLVDYFQLDGWPMVDALAQQLHVHLVRGAQSDRWTEQELARVGSAGLAPNVHEHVVAEAGHWLHVDNPSGLLEAMRRSAFFAGLQDGPRMRLRPGSEGQ